MDDILCIHHDLDGVLEKLIGYVPLKPSSVGRADMYLGTKIKYMQLHNGIWDWSMSPSKNVQEAVRMGEEYVHQKGQIIHSRAAIALNWCS